MNQRQKFQLLTEASIVIWGSLMLASKESISVQNPQGFQVIFNFLAPLTSDLTGVGVGLFEFGLLLVFYLVYKNSMTMDKPSPRVIFKTVIELPQNEERKE